jgi:adrenodoxin-NADP+ reductase
MNPIRFESDDAINDRVGRVVCERTKLVGDPFHQQPIGTNETEVIPADLVLVSIGYRGMPLEGMQELQIFDSKKGIVANVQGKVCGKNNLFVTGWIKRGPLGIIGTNIMDAKETVASIMDFIESGELSAQQAEGSMVPAGREGLTEYLGRAGVETISWSQFLKIDAAESVPARLRSNTQPREKIITTDDLLEVALQH